MRVGDANNRDGDAIQADSSANGGWSGTERADPVGVIQNDDGRRGGRIIGGSERAANESLDAESGKKIAGNVQAAGHAGGAVATKVDAHWAGEGGHAGESACLRANGFEEGYGEGAITDASLIRAIAVAAM